MYIYGVVRVEVAQFFSGESAVIRPTECCRRKNCLSWSLRQVQLLIQKHGKRLLQNANFFVQREMAHVKL